MWVIFFWSIDLVIWLRSKVEGWLGVEFFEGIPRLAGRRRGRESGGPGFESGSARAEAS